ncbi:MAG: CdvA-like protein [Nitrososphaeraceae archaeon]
MSELKLEFVGKQVKDMYGTYIGKVIGTVTDIDGSIESIGVDCGSLGLKQLPYEQLLIQGDYVIYIPRWRMDSQKLLRQKNLTLKRIKALQDLVAENDMMKNDAEILHLKYEKRLQDLQNSENEVIEMLKLRLEELDLQNTNVKTVIFDAKLQYRSNDMNEQTYQDVNANANILLEHINLEKEEINSFLARISQSVEDNEAIDKESNSDNAITTANYENGDSKNDSNDQRTPIAIGGEESKTNNDDESNWLNEVLAKEIRHNR